jgi:hypothetical protein
VIIGQSYAIRSLPSAICMRIIPSEGPVNILNFAANAHWYARGSSQDGSINGSRLSSTLHRNQFRRTSISMSSGWD